MKGSKYNHGASNKGCKESGSSEYGSPKKIGAGMKKPSPDGNTPAFGKGHANQGGKKNGKFQDKGVILRSSVAQNVRCILGLFEQEEASMPPVPLVKPCVRRIRSSRSFNTSPYKTWLNSKEIAAMIALLQRALILIDEHEEGNLDLRDILSEDEDGMYVVNTSFIDGAREEGAFAPRGTPYKPKS